jgi:hypothetical protein
MHLKENEPESLPGYAWSRATSGTFANGISYLFF